MKLSFVVVTYQSIGHLPELWASLTSSAAPHDEIIFVDNASADGTTDFLESLQDPRVLRVMNTVNRGYGAAVNQAAFRAQGDVLMLVNPDCSWRLTPNALSEWVRRNLEDKGDLGQSTAAVGPLISYPDGSPQPSRGGFSSLVTYILQFLRAGAMARSLGLAFVLARLAQGYWSVFLPRSVRGFLSNYRQRGPSRAEPDWVSAAFLAIRKKDFLAADGFDERIFLYCEDEDLCRRIRLKGSTIVFDPEIKILHAVAGSQEAGAFSMAQAHRYRSNIYYLSKWSGPVAAAALRAFYALAFPLKALWALLSLNFEKASAQMKYWIRVF